MQQLLVARWAWILLGVVLLATQSIGAPERIRYQGRLVDASGPVNGPQVFTFRFFLVPEGGKALYTETQNVHVNDGYYAVELGANATPGSLRAVFDFDTVYLEVTVDGATLSPREEFGSIPHALTAETVSPDGVASKMIALNAIRDAELDEDAAVRSLNELDGDLVLEGVGIEVTPGASNNLVLSAEGFGDSPARQRTVRLPVADGQAVSAGDVVTLYDGQIMTGWWTEPSGVASNAEADLDCAVLDEDHVVVVWRSGLAGHSGGMKLGTLSDRTFSWGPGRTFEAGGAADICMAALDEERFVVAYRDEYNGNRGTARIGYRNGGDLLWRGDPFIFNSNATHHIAVTALTTGRYAVAYQASDGYGWITVADAGPEETVASWRREFMSLVSDIAIAAWPPNHQTSRSHQLVVAFRNGYSGNHGSIAPIRVVDEDIFLGDEDYYDFTDDPAGDLATVTLDDDLFAVSWSDDATGQGWTILGEKVVYTVGYGGYRWRPIWGTISQFHRGSTSDIVMRSADGRNVSVSYREGSSSRHLWGRLSYDAPRTLTWQWENACGPSTFSDYGWALFPDNRVVAAIARSSDIDLRLGFFGRVAGLAVTDATDGQYCPVATAGVAMTGPGWRTTDRVYHHDGKGLLNEPDEANRQPIGLALDHERVLLVPDLEAGP